MKVEYRIETVGRQTTHYLKIGKNILYVNRAVGQSEADMRKVCQDIVDKLESEEYAPERSYI